VLSELAKQDVMSRLTKLEQKMNDLDRNADALIDELESLEVVARELKMTDSVDKFDKYIEEVGQIKEDLSCKLSDEIENEQMRELVDARIKTIPIDIETLRSEYNSARNKLVEIREELRKSRLSRQN
jgi:DNA repair exonuclease SbcCD ATPase subunit